MKTDLPWLRLPDYEPKQPWPWKTDLLGLLLVAIIIGACVAVLFVGR